MSRFVKCFVCALAVVAIAGVAQAATVDLVLTSSQTALGSNAGTWVLTAQASLGDNAGIAGYNIEIVGSATAISGGPKGTNQAGFKAMGFTVNNADFTGDGAMFAGQNSTAADTIMYGVGQTPWADAFAFFPGSELASDDTPTIPYDVPVRLGWGTADDYTAVNFGQSTNVNLWLEEGTVAAEPAGEVIAAVAYVPAIPEPASFAILGIAVLGLIGLRRKLG